MHRTDGDAHVGNMFVDGDPAVPSVGTQVEKDWLNAVQEEICNVITGAGFSLVKGTNTQLKTALALLNTTRAFGVVQTSNPAGSAPALRSGSVNLGVPSLIAGVPNKIRIPFLTAFADVFFTPIITDCGTTLGANPSTCLHYTAINWTTTYVEVKVYDMAGAEVDPATLTSRSFSVTILK